MLKYTKILLRNVNPYHKYVNELFLNNNLTKFLFINNRSSSNSVLKCWKCNAEQNSVTIFCDKCKIIQKPHTTDNYFKILGINESYAIDLKALTQTYRTLQAFLHPDKYSNSSDEEKVISADYSSIVNRAYNTIQSPINRGLHLLALNGEKINEDSDKNADQEFLMEIMELNEEVEDAETPEQLINLNKKNKQELENIAQNLSKAFDSKNILEAKKVLIRMKYYVSISAQINGILREKGIVE